MPDAGSALNGHEAGNGGDSQGQDLNGRDGQREGPNREESESSVSRGKAMHQMSLWELPLEGRGEAPRAERSGEAGRAVHGKERSGSEHSQLMERVVARENAMEALKRVRRSRAVRASTGCGWRSWNRTCTNAGE